MKKIIFYIFIVFNLSGAIAQNIHNVNPDPNGDPWIVGGFREPSSVELNKIPELVLPQTLTRSELP